MTEEKNTINRRQFLTRLGKAGVSVAGATVASYLLYDRHGPKLLSQTGKIITTQDFPITPIQGKTISIVRGSDRTKTVQKAIELLGGMERFIKPGDTVLIKPNVAFASPPALGATAHPDVVSQVAKLSLKAKAKQVIVTDNPINEPASCFTLSGIAKAVGNTSAKVVMPKDHMFKLSTLKNGRLIKNWPVYLEPLEKADKLIGIAPVKNHHRSGASMTMKNFYGLLGGRRNIFHQDINSIIAELAMLVKPTLVILDGTESMITNGPTGGSLSDLKKTNTMIASCDMVAADSYGASLLDLKVSDLPYLTKAQNNGCGTTDYQSLKPLITTVT